MSGWLNAQASRFGYVAAAYQESSAEKGEEVMLARITERYRVLDDEDIVREAMRAQTILDRRSIPASFDFKYMRIALAVLVKRLSSMSVEGVTLAANLRLATEEIARLRAEAKPEPAGREVLLMVDGRGDVMREVSSEFVETDLAVENGRDSRRKHKCGPYRVVRAVLDESPVTP